MNAALKKTNGKFSFKALGALTRALPAPGGMRSGAGRRRRHRTEIQVRSELA